MKVSEFLKQNTKNLHDRVEEGFESHKIFEKTFTFDDYRRLIQYNYHFINQFENQVFDTISPSFSDKINLNERRKKNALDKDLEQLGIVGTKKNEFISVENENEALGILYVMEGATLGGNVIAKQLSKIPRFEEKDFHYFSIYGEKTGEFWKNFKENLDEIISENDYQKVLKGTKKAYEFLLTLF